METSFYALDVDWMLRCGCDMQKGRSLGALNDWHARVNHKSNINYIFIRNVAV